MGFCLQVQQKFDDSLCSMTSSSKNNPTQYMLSISVGELSQSFSKEISLSVSYQSSRINLKSHIPFNVSLLNEYFPRSLRNHRRCSHQGESEEFNGNNSHPRPKTGPYLLQHTLHQLPKTSAVETSITLEILYIPHPLSNNCEIIKKKKSLLCS